MFLKREIYSGNKDDKFFQITSALKKAGIKYDVRMNGSEHIADLGRGAGVGRFGQSYTPSTCSVYVSKNDYDAAMAVLHG
ncbi:MAG: hypothetical protein J6Y08_01330 [Clostridiales bacterium]|nr:hypothetical protein [Clostridiales bacterium]